MLQMIQTAGVATRLLKTLDATGKKALIDLAGSLVTNSFVNAEAHPLAHSVVSTLAGSSDPEQALEGMITSGQFVEALKLEKEKKGKVGPMSGDTQAVICPECETNFGVRLP